MATTRQLTPQRTRMKINRKKKRSENKRFIVLSKQKQVFAFLSSQAPNTWGAQERCVPKIGLQEHPRGEITRNSKERP